MLELSSAGWFAQESHKDAGTDLSSPIKRNLHEYNLRGFTVGSKPLVSLKKRKVRKKTEKDKSRVVEQSSKGQKKEKMSLYQNDRKGESMEEKRESFRIKVHCPICETLC